MRKTKIEEKLRRKTDQDLVETIIAGKKTKEWLKVADKISMPKRKQPSLNLDQINEQSKDNQIVIVPGKVLGMGTIDKKIKVVALSFSESAKTKLKEEKVEFATIGEEIKKNPKGEKIVLLS